MKLLLTLLAILAGFAGADRAAAAPATPVAMGSVIMMAEAANQNCDAARKCRPVATEPARRSTTTPRKPQRSTTPQGPGLLTGADRALE